MHESLNKLVRSRIEEMRDEHGDDIKCNETSIQSFIRYLERYIELTKKATRLESLDRHKILGALTLSIMTFRPLTVVGNNEGKARKQSYYANELLSIVLCEDILFLFMLKQYCEKHNITDRTTRVRYSDYLRSRYAPPDNIRDKNSVTSCLMKALSRIKRAKLPETLKSGLPESQLAEVLLVAHIYFYFESYNWSNWDKETVSGDSQSAPLPM